MILGFFYCLSADIFSKPFFDFKELISSLIIGTVIIHPLLFYFFFISTIMKYYFQYSFASCKPYFSNKFLCIVLSFTLFLGSIWAMQSNTWGYFWVNDAIEWLLLFLIIYILYSTHCVLKVNLSLNIFGLVCTLISALIFVRLNFIPTRHNFIVSASTVYIMLLIYFSFFEFLKKFYFCLCNWQVLKLKYVNHLFMFFLAFFFILHWLSLLRSLFVCSVFFLFSKKLLNQLSYKLLHILVAIFFCVWGCYFTNFFLEYSFGFLTSPTIYLFENGIIVSFYYFYLNVGFFLETLVFNFKNYCWTTFININGCFLNVYLNSYYFFIFFILILLKIIETGWI